MLRIAILEKEQCAKDIIFECAKIVTEMEWSFAHYTKISEFAKADTHMKFDILIMNELFHTPRVFASFIEHEPKRIVIYCMETSFDGDTCLQDRILYIDRHHIKTEMKRIKEHLLSLLRPHKEYLLSYNHVLVPLQIQDIYYVEKKEKNIIFHSARGLFRERKTMAAAETYFKAFDFIRIHSSYLVNVQHIVSIHADTMRLDNKDRLPIARARRKAVTDWFHRYVKQHSTYHE